MDRNVKIPLSLLSQTIELLEHWNLDGYDPAILCDYDIVYMAFLKKRQSLVLREAYSKIIFAEDENDRFEARMRYLQQKRDYAGFF
jgi:hypothetical protein